MYVNASQDGVVHVVTRRIHLETALQDRLSRDVVIVDLENCAATEDVTIPIRTSALQNSLFVTRMIVHVVACALIRSSTSAVLEG